MRDPINSEMERADAVENVELRSGRPPQLRLDRGERSDVPSVEAGRLLAPPAGPAIVIIDERTFTRDCIAQSLRIAHGEATVVSYETVDEFLNDPSDFRALDLVLYNIGGRRATDPEVDRDIGCLMEAYPAVPIALLSEIEEADRIAEAIERGTRGYIPTSVNLAVAVEAMRLIRAGGTFVPARSLVHSVSNPGRISAGRRVKAPSDPRLTPRQMAVLHCLRQGKANKEIAKELNLRESTVKVHLAHIMRRLNARNRTQVALLANGLLERNDPA
jgi:DNA-binding NarL/FixJ family response regulator